MLTIEAHYQHVFVVPKVYKIIQPTELSNTAFSTKVYVYFMRYLKSFLFDRVLIHLTFNLYIRPVY